MSKIPLQPYKRPEPPPSAGGDMIRATMTTPPNEPAASAPPPEEQAAPEAREPEARASAPAPASEPIVEERNNQNRATTVTSVRVDVEDWKEFRILALKEGTDASALVREAMRRFLALRRKKK